MGETILPVSFLKISILGLGYVGSVSAGCLADLGHEIIGVDVDERKVASFNSAVPPISEPGLNELFKANAKKLSATTDSVKAVLESDASIVCVGTPSLPSGGVDISNVMSAVEQVAQGMRRKKGFHVVMMRSTIPPGTTEEKVIPLLEKTSGKKCGKEFGVAYNPEFLREGSAIADFKSPGRTVFACSDAQSEQAMRTMVKGINAPIFKCSFKTAEFIKYIDNSFHAVKVAFANEYGSLVKAYGVDAREVGEIFLADTKLNIAPYYLKPGMPIGGSCLPKDTRGAIDLARKKGVEVPVIEAALRSDAAHLERLYQRIRSLPEPLLLVGLSFKTGTDDVRESPMLKIAERLLADHKNFKIYDSDVDPAKIVGQNKALLSASLPNFQKFIVGLEGSEVLGAFKSVVLLKKIKEVGPKLKNFGGKVLDGANYAELKESCKGYEGFLW
jgi:GDP-mannose 6-dehydrogenase